MGRSSHLRIQRYGKGGVVKGGAKERGQLADTGSWLCVLYWSAREAILLRAVTNIGLYSEQYRLVREGLLLCAQTSRCLYARVCIIYGRDIGSCAVEEGILLVDGEEWIFVRCLLLVVYVLFLTFVGLSQVASSFEKEGGGEGALFSSGLILLLVGV